MALIGLVILLGGVAVVLRVWIRTAGSHGPATRPDNGLLAPDLAARAVGGAVIRLRDLRGRPVILTFLASQSASCQATAMEVQAIQMRRGSLAVVLGLTVEDTAITAQSFVTRYGLTFPLLLDEEGRIAALYRVREVPSTFVIGPDGVIVETVNGPVTRERLNKILDALSPPGNDLAPIKGFFSSLLRGHLHELS